MDYLGRLDWDWDGGERAPWLGSLLDHLLGCVQRCVQRPGNSATQPMPSVALPLVVGGCECPLPTRRDSSAVVAVECYRCRAVLGCAVPSWPSVCASRHWARGVRARLSAGECVVFSPVNQASSVVASRRDSCWGACGLRATHDRWRYPRCGDGPFLIV
jgi:hypothetical protein